MQIRLASSTDLEPLSKLFNQYRQSLGQAADYTGCYVFLKNRLVENDSMIFVSIKEGVMVGFIQLYPSFSSLLLTPVWYFEDAFVVDGYQDQNIADSMYHKAKLLAESTGVLLLNRNDSILSPD